MKFGLYPRLALAGIRKNKRLYIPYLLTCTGMAMMYYNIGAGPISFGITDSIGRTHCDVQFAGSSSVPAHVEMMGLMGMGNNPMVGASVACAVAVSQALAQ